MSALVVLATLGYRTSRRITEIGLALGLVGALGLAGGNVRRPGAPVLALIGALALAVGLGLVVVAVHWGISPYRR